MFKAYLCSYQLIDNSSETEIFKLSTYFKIQMVMCCVAANVSVMSVSFCFK